MKKILFITAFLGAISLFAQQTDSILVSEIPEIRNNILEQKQEIAALTKIINNQSNTLGKQSNTIKSLQNANESFRVSLDSLTQLIENNNDKIEKKSSELVTQLLKTEESANSEIIKLSETIDNNWLYWIIATLVTFLLGGLVYWLLRKRIQSNKTDVETQIKNTKTALEEESVKLDNKLVEVLSKQLELINIEDPIPVETNEKSHSLVLKVADRLNSMEKNLSRMDPTIKGHKNLIMAIKNIKDNYAANGYELVEMLGKDYNEGMKAIVNFLQDEDFEKGKRVITRIIKPQVNYKGTMIQTAQIEVTEA